MTNLKTKILDTVEKNNIRMIPKWKFVLYSVLGMIGIVFVFLLAVFSFSLVLFVVSKSGVMHMPLYGLMTALYALNAIPLLLLLVTIVLLIIIELISQQYSFSFRRPLMVTLLVVTSLAVLVSFAVSQTSMHEYVRDYAKSHRMSMMSRAYERPLPFKNIDGMTVVRGVVEEVSASTTVLRLFDGTLLKTFASTTGTGMMPEVGEDVVMLGSFSGDRFEVQAIREPGTPFNKGQKSGKRDGSGKELRQMKMERMEMK